MAPTTIKTCSKCGTDKTYMQNNHENGIMTSTQRNAYVKTAIAKIEQNQLSI